MSDRVSKRVLLVDDEGVLRDLLTRGLREAGLGVVASATAPEALSVLRQEPHGIDLVIADVWMPGMTGIELVAQVRRRWPDLPVLFISGDELPAHAPDAPLLRKPFALNELVTAIDSHLR